MSLKRKLHHENWPAPLFYAPVAAYYIYTSLRLRKLNYFTAVNPAMKTGGLCGFSKFKSFKNISSKYLPRTEFIEAGDSVVSTEMSFPAILKPDQGERGLLVSKVESLEEVNEILSKNSTLDFILQEYVGLPLELGVFFIKKNDEWEIPSITSKKFLSLTGDGFSSLEQLALKDERARKFTHKLLDQKKVLAKGETLLVEPIGNHSRGTQFVDECHHISKKLTSSFDDFLLSLDGINYCRLDLRTSSWEELEEANFKIMEINGVSAEPGHIYDPNTSVKQAYKDLFSHWRDMSAIAKDNIKNENVETFKETVKIVKSHLSNKKKALKK